MNPTRVRPCDGVELVTEHLAQEPGSRIPRLHHEASGLPCAIVFVQSPYRHRCERVQLGAIMVYAVVRAGLCALGIPRLDGSAGAARVAKGRLRRRQRAVVLDKIRFPVPAGIQQVDGGFNHCRATYYARCDPSFAPCAPGQAAALSTRLVSFYSLQRIGELTLGPLKLGHDGYGLRWKATATLGETTVQLDITVDGALPNGKPEFAASATGVGVEMLYSRAGWSRPYGKPPPPDADRCLQPAKRPAQPSRR
jgi:hypothetical protein